MDQKFKNDPHNREDATRSLTDVYKDTTPGEKAESEKKKPRQITIKEFLKKHQEE